jgi:hypothetical protein
MGLGLCSLAQAQQYGGYPVAGYGQTPVPPSAMPVGLPGYPAQPAFNTQLPAQSGWVGPQRSAYRPVSTDGQALGMAPQPSPDATFGSQMLPAPAGMHASAPMMAPSVADYGAVANPGCASCNTAPAYTPMYSEPMISSYAPAPSCGPYISGPVPIKPWFFGAHALFFNRVDNCDLRLLIDVAAPSTTILSTSDAAQDWSPGFEVFGGRYFNCGRNAIMASYWFVNPDLAERTVQTGANDYRTPMPSWDAIYMDDGDPATVPDPTFYDLYDTATAYRLRRDSEFHNLEVNVVGFGIGGVARAGCASSGCGSCGTGNSCNPCNCGSCGPVPGCGGACGPVILPCSSKVRLQWLGGVRWFRFEDNFEFASSQVEPGYGPTDDDLYYNVDVTNDLVGFQGGARLDYCLGHRMNAYIGSKAGIYGNNIQLDQRLGTTDSAGYLTATPYPAFAGQSIDIHANDTVLAFLGELDFGLGYRITPCWSINGGYRIIGASGVATSVGQIPADLAHLRDASEICGNEALILHGGYAGVNYNW